ncbi:MAG: hypothetical protein Kow0010_15460 [Dehalococcoidia bacterium]
MGAFIDRLEVNSPGPVEALLLVACIGAAASLWRAVGWGLSAIMVVCIVISYAQTGNAMIAIGVSLVALGVHLLRRRRTDLRVDHGYALGQFAVVALGYVAYILSRLHSEGTFEAATTNADRIVKFETKLGLFFERDLQQLIIDSDVLVQVFSTIYSFMFLAFVLSVLIWLLVVDRGNYRIMRNALGVSVVLAAVTIALFPVAPPRLMPELDIVSTVELLGRQHAFTNEYAAVPSLHVGWMVLAGFVLARSIGGRTGSMVGVLPGTVMMVTVIVSGNHYWIDGVIGTAYTMIPALWFAYGGRLRAGEPSVESYA